MGYTQTESGRWLVGKKGAGGRTGREGGERGVKETKLLYVQAWNSGNKKSNGSKLNPVPAAVFFTGPLSGVSQSLVMKANPSVPAHHLPS